VAGQECEYVLGRLGQSGDGAGCDSDLAKREARSIQFTPEREYAATLVEEELFHAGRTQRRCQLGIAFLPFDGKSPFPTWQEIEPPSLLPCSE